MHSCEADFILIHTPNKNIFDVKPNELLLDATVFNGEKSNKFIRIVERKDEFIRMSEDSFEEKKWRNFMRRSSRKRKKRCKQSRLKEFKISIWSDFYHLKMQIDVLFRFKNASFFLVQPLKFYWMCIISFLRSSNNNKGASRNDFFGFFEVLCTEMD